MISNIKVIDKDSQNTTAMCLEHRSGGGKLLYISVIRCLAMLLIITCHICQFYDNEWAWWLNVGVQIFFILSGLLYGNKRIDNPIAWLKHNIIKILLPYYIFLSIAIILYYGFAPESINIFSVIRSIFCVGTIDGIGHLWFVGYILFCYILTPYLALFANYLLTPKRDCKYQICMIVIFLAIFYIICFIINFYFRPDKILCYLIGYFSAFFVSKYGDKTYIILFFAFTPLAILSKLIFIFCFSHIESIEGFSHMLLGVSLTYGMILLFKKIKLINNKVIEPILTFSDKNSYYIYLVHQLFILSPFTLMSFTDYPLVNIGMMLIIVFMIGVVLQVSCTKLFQLLFYQGNK